MPKSLDNYTVPELKAVAKKRGFVGYSRLRKSELIKMLRKKQHSRVQSPKKSPKKSLGGLAQQVKSATWFVFTKEGCSYCQKAKDLLKKEGLRFKERKITDKNKEKVYADVDGYTKKYRYYPMIFNRGKFVGGYTELEKMLKQ